MKNKKFKEPVACFYELRDLSIICKIGSLRWGNRASARELQANVVLPEAVARDAQTQHRYEAQHALAQIEKKNFSARSLPRRLRPASKILQA